MEPKAEYKVKERPFHGDYLQGKRPEQYESGAILLGLVLGAILAMILIFGCYKVGEFLIEFTKAL